MFPSLHCMGRLDVAQLRRQLHGRSVGIVGISVVSGKVFLWVFLCFPGWATLGLLLGRMWPTGHHLNRTAISNVLFLSWRKWLRLTKAKVWTVNLTRMLDDNEMLTSRRWCCCYCLMLLFMTPWPSPFALSHTLSLSVWCHVSVPPPSHGTITNQPKCCPPTEPLNSLTLSQTPDLSPRHYLPSDTYPWHPECTCVCVCVCVCVY